MKHTFFATLLNVNCTTPSSEKYFLKNNILFFLWSSFRSAGIPFKHKNFSKICEKSTVHINTLEHQVNCTEEQSSPSNMFIYMFHNTANMKS